MLLWWLSRPGWSTYSLVIQFAVLECFSWIYHQGKKETYPLNYMILCPFRKSLLTLWHSNRAFVSTSRRSQRIMNSRTDTQAIANSLLSKSIKMEKKRNWNYPLESWIAVYKLLGHRSENYGHLMHIFGSLFNQWHVKTMLFGFKRKNRKIKLSPRNCEFIQYLRFVQTHHQI